MVEDLRALRIHGDVQTQSGGVDFAVNVHGDRPPGWLTRRLRARITDLAAYPSVADDLRARRAVAEWHGTDEKSVLPLAGSAEGFHLLANHAARHGMRAAVVHPSFTEPEVELRRARVPVTRVVLPEPYAFDTALVPEEADFVVIGNPTNPTSVLHPRESIAALCRPGRVTVVDEAFCDVLDDEADYSLAGARLPGLVVLRSITKTWSLAGLRAGYAVGDPAVLADLAAHRVHWPVGTLQLEAITACCSAEAAGHLERIRDRIRRDRSRMCELLAAAGIEVAVPPSAPFILARAPAGLDPTGFRHQLLERGFVVRRCDTFPGLDAGHVRLAVRDSDTVRGLIAAWKQVAATAGPVHR
ncbi:Rv2231c family pyridoxal phosphate-dependent protein CobC [Rhodococcus sp. IEGM 1408]|uniref:Rv2231c family pyridoxal phosphate-dependent protein CobC n=1 Tax=Rhodococcus sp. IEGM 1408 TaxID=3082220 RepID=UPI00295440A6|nr:Rv2231c family pyridoxal phosphate-dependent protein CobC [Rhodococcus sp. IEGM 1408]MDV8002965.1 Rv2231c family pyridoxal phosphate-dependent protein CobC [Rhodococcus sp. IEGM 1408]